MARQEDLRRTTPVGKVAHGSGQEDLLSAFGVVHKSWKKMDPKLNRAGSFVARPTDDMAQRMKVNYSQWRAKSGWLAREINPRKWEANDAANLKAGLGPPSARSLEARARNKERAREQARKLKEGSQAAITARANNTKRNRRYLP